MNLQQSKETRYSHCPWNPIVREQGWLSLQSYKLFLLLSYRKKKGLLPLPIDLLSFAPHYVALYWWPDCSLMHFWKTRDDKQSLNITKTLWLKTYEEKRNVGYSFLWIWHSIRIRWERKIEGKGGRPWEVWMFHGYNREAMWTLNWIKSYRLILISIPGAISLSELSHWSWLLLFWSGCFHYYAK